MIPAGLLGALSFTFAGIWPAVLGVLLVQLQLLLDCSDGEVARWRKQFSPIGVYLDQLAHYSTEAAIPAAIGVRADGGWDSIGGWTALGLLASVLILFLKSETHLVQYALQRSDRQRRGPGLLGAGGLQSLIGPSSTTASGGPGCSGESSRASSHPEGSGTMLDNSLILWASEFSYGGKHSVMNLPVALAGRAGGMLNAGRFVRTAPDGLRHRPPLYARRHWQPAHLRPQPVWLLRYLVRRGVAGPQTPKSPLTNLYSTPGPLPGLTS